MIILWLILGSTLGFFISSALGASKTNELYAELSKAYKENEDLYEEVLNLRADNRLLEQEVIGRM